MRPVLNSEEDSFACLQRESFGGVEGPVNGEEKVCKAV